MDLTIVGISLQASHKYSVALSTGYKQYWQDLTSHLPFSILPYAQTPEMHLEQFFVLRLE